MSNNDVYFAAEENPEDVASVLVGKASDWFDTISSNNYLDKVRNSWQAYHGMFYNNSGHQISYTGEQGELVQLPINHYSNIAKNMLTMVTASRPAFQSRAVNSDAKSVVQTRLANQLLEYYMREKKLEFYLKTAVEYAIVLGSGFIKMEWNSTTGEIYDYNEVTGTPIYEGDVEFKVLTPFDVVFDVTKDNIRENDWVICRTWKNKYDVAAKYPEFADEIKALKTKSDLHGKMFYGRNFDKTVDIPVYEFYHKKTESVPEGRYLLYLSKDIVLLDMPLPYRELPIYALAPSYILGTQFGYTSMFDLLPIQEALNTLHSIVFTNQSTFGVQNIVVRKGSGFNVAQIEGGLNVVEVNPGFEAPSALNLTQTPPEIFNYINSLVQNMEIISGVNAVARGNPESMKSLSSGNALALVQSQALQFMNGLQQSYIRMIEDVGTGLVALLRDFASVPRIAAIVGKNNRTEMMEFTGDDISLVNRVVVDVGNALAGSTAGRVQMAEQLMQMKPDEFSISQYIQVMNTGRLDLMTEDINNEATLIRTENEYLVEGKPVSAVATDHHIQHIREHRSVLADPELRNDANLVVATLDHIEQHLTLLRETNPDLLMIIQEQPLGPVGGSPANQPPQGAPPPDQSMAPMGVTPDMQQNPNPGPMPLPAEPPPVNDPRQM